MITPAYSPTATERVLPRLALDFTTASLDPRVTVTRALNTATRFNSSGFIEGVNADLPRFDFDPVTKVCRGLLIEETRTNLCTYSQAISSTANWNANTTVTTTTSGAPLSPDNSSSMVKLVESAVNQNQRISSPFLGQAATTYTWSVFAKAAERSILQLTVGGGISGTSYANFDLANGVIGSYVGNVPIITPVGNGIYRCQMTVTSGSASSDVAYFNIQTSTSAARGAAYAGDGSSGLYVWGAVFEAGTFATSYIPTTTTSLTRNADQVSMTGTNFSSWYNQSEGTFTISAISKAPTNISAFYFMLIASDGTTSERIQLVQDTANATFAVIDNGGAQAVLNGSITTGQLLKAAMAYKQNDFAAAFNGATPVTDTSGNVPTPTRLNIGAAWDGTQFPFSGWIGDIDFYPQRLTLAEVQAFSK